MICADCGIPTVESDQTAADPTDAPKPVIPEALFRPPPPPAPRRSPWHGVAAVIVAIGAGVIIWFTIFPSVPEIDVSSLEDAVVDRVGELWSCRLQEPATATAWVLFEADGQAAAHQVTVRDASVREHLTRCLGTQLASWSVPEFGGQRVVNTYLRLTVGPQTVRIEGDDGLRLSMIAWSTRMQLADGPGSKEAFTEPMASLFENVLHCLYQPVIIELAPLPERFAVPLSVKYDGNGGPVRIVAGAPGLKKTGGWWSNPGVTQCVHRAGVSSNLPGRDGGYAVEIDSEMLLERRAL